MEKEVPGLVNVYKKLMGKIHHAMKMGKSTISMAMFNSYVTNYQRVHIVPHTHDFFIPPWALKTLNPISKIDIK